MAAKIRSTVRGLAVRFPLFKLGNRLAPNARQFSQRLLTQTGFRASEDQIADECGPCILHGRESPVLVGLR